MIDFFKSLLVHFVEPINIFDQLEERIVLDAAVAQTVDQNQIQSNDPSAQAGEQGSDQHAEANSAPESSPADTSSTVAPDPHNDQSGTEAPRVLLVSSQVYGADALVAAHQDGVITVTYNAQEDSPEQILAAVRIALNGEKAQSIALATHDVGEGTFHLTGTEYVSSETLQNSLSLQSFWKGLGDLLVEDGRIDILACNLTANADGIAVVSEIALLSGHEVAGSNDPTGNAACGGDWLLETGGVNLIDVYFSSDTINEFQGLLATIDLGGKTAWTTVMYGASFDPAKDLQANVKGQDLLGDDTHGVLYTAYEKNGPGTDDDIVAFRIRLDGDDGKGNLVPFIFIGIDADLDGSLDIFVGLNPNTDKVVIFDPGSGDNTAPNNTTYFQANPYTVGYYAKAPSQYAWAFDSAVPGTTQLDNYDFSPVSSTNDPHYQAKDDPDGTGPLTSDLDGGGVNDRFASFAISFKALHDELLQDQGILITPDTPMRYVLGTATQDNSFNSDMGGIGKEFSPNSSTTWEQLGLFSPVLSLSNMFPVGQPDSYSLFAGDSVTGNLLANDTDPNPGETATLQVTSLDASKLAHGTLHVDSATGAFTYTSTDPSFTGTETFTYRPVDVHGAQSITPVTVTITVQSAPASNVLPVAVNDSLSLLEDTSGTGNVLNNDTDSDGPSSLTAKLATGPSHGTLSLNADGSYVYTPFKDYYGHDSFTYFAYDGQNDSSTPATVNITVNAVPESVTAEGSEDSTITVPLLESGVTVTGITLGTPTHGTVTPVDTDGDSKADKYVYYPDPDYNGTDSFSYTITYPDGSRFTGTATITVLPVNDAPVARTDSVVTNEDVSVTINATTLLANDTDVDGDTLILILDAHDPVNIVTLPEHGTLTYDGTSQRYTYTPDPNYSGADSFTYVVADRSDPSDITRLTATGTVNITVLGVNDPPVAQDDPYVMSEDPDPSSPLTGDVSLNDSDPDHATSLLSYSLVQAPLHGTLSLNTDGTFTYTPDKDYSNDGTGGQPDTFVYRVTDPLGGTATATVSITVTEVNDPPVGTPDSASVTEGESVDIYVLSNDTDTDTDPTLLSVKSFTQPSHGVVTENPDGSLTYAADANFSGNDAFTYVVSDGALDSDPVEVTITVLASSTNDPPVGTPDSFDVTEGSSVSGNVLLNDYDPDGDSLDIQLKTPPANGTLIWNGDGSFTYSPTGDTPGDDFFLYTVNDGSGPVTVRVDLHVTQVNDVPVAQDDTYAVDKNAVLTVPVASGLLKNDSDADLDPLHAFLVTAPQHGSVSINTDGSFVYTPDADYSGPDSFVYRATDGSAADTATVAITVNPLNSPPVANPDSFVVQEQSAPGTPIPLDVLSNDSDPENSPLILADGTYYSVHGTVEISGGVLSYVPDPEFFGTDTFTYTVSDGEKTSNPATVTITVTNVNDDPVANPDAFEGSEDASATGNLLANDTDPDGDTLVVTTTGSSATDRGGTVTIAADGSFVYTPKAGFFGDDTFQYAISDQHGGTATTTVTIKVAAVNDPPVANPDTTSTNENTPVTILGTTLVSNDTDVENDTLTVISVSNGTHGAVTLSGGDVTYTPSLYFSGQDTFTYVVSDGHGGTDIGTVTVTVNAVPSGPTAVDDYISGSEDQQVSGTVASNDFHPDGVALTLFTKLSDPGSGVLSFNSANGSFTYTPAANVTGDVFFTYKVTDANGKTDDATVAIHLNPVNDPPVAQNFSETTDENVAKTINFVGHATDPDDNQASLTYSLVSGAGPSHGTVTNNGNGTFTYTPTTGYFGTDSFQYKVTDSAGAFSIATVTVTVNNPNDPPVAVEDFYVQQKSVSATLWVLLNDTDGDNDDLTIQSLNIDSSQGTATINPDGKTIAYVAPNASGIYSFTYVVTDGHESSTTTVWIDTANGQSVGTSDDAVSTTIDTALPITPASLLLNDNKMDAIFAVSQALHGTVTYATSGTTITSITYTPDPGFTGVDTFSYAAIDNAGSGTPTNAKDTSLVTVTVTGTVTNHPPVAGDDTLSATEDTPLVIDAATLLTNDSDPDSGDSIWLPGGQTLTAQHGTVTYSATGGKITSITYKPVANYYGDDSFTYAIRDTAGKTDTATVNITVQPVNDAPSAVNDSFTLSEDTTLTKSLLNEGVLGNDSDPDDAKNMLAVTLVTGPANGSVDLHSDGTFSYTPEENYNGSDTFTYKVTDSAGNFSVATVSLTVTPVNDPPVAGVDNATVTEDGTVNINVLANDNDLDGDTLTVSLPSLQSANKGTLTLESDGTVTYTPAANFNGSDSFTYQISDGHGNTTTGQVHVTVIPVNDSPIGVSDGYSVAEETPFLIQATDLLGNDSDPDTPGVPPPALVLVSGPSHGTLKDNGDGSFTYTPAEDFFGKDTFTYRAKDAQGALSDVVTVTMTVTNQNDPPTALPDKMTVQEDSDWKQIDVLANDSDRDGDTLSLTDGTYRSDHGTVNISGGKLYYKPDADYSGPDTFTYEVKDSPAGAAATARVNVTVSPENDPPAPANDSYTVGEGQSVTGNVLTNDSDPDGDALTVQLKTDPSTLQGTLVWNGDGTFTYTPQGENPTGESFYYTVSDGTVTSDPVRVDLHVLPVNDPPQAMDDSVSVFEDEHVTIKVLPNDSDADDALSTLTVTILSGPEHGTLTAGSNPGEFIYTPSYESNSVETDSFAYRLTDPHGAFSDATVVITVNPKNDAPIARPDTFTIAEDSGPVELNVLANDFDADGDSIVLEDGSYRSAHGTVTIKEGGLTYEPDKDFNGSDTFTYEVKDPSGATSTATVKITVQPVNDPPTPRPDSFELAEGSTLTGNVLTNDSDPDGDSLTVQLVTDPTTLKGTLVWNGDGTFTYTPDGDDPSDEVFYYTVKDAGGTSGPIRVDLKVVAVNDSPEAQPDAYSVDEDHLLTVSAPAHGVLDNDTDPEGDALQAEVLTRPAHGTVILNTDGTFTYSPDHNFNGEDTFTYQANDGNGGVDVATVTITVRPVNDSPVAEGETYITKGGAPVSGSVLSNDSDPDAGDTLTVGDVHTGTRSTDHGIVTLNEDGSFIYTPNPGFTGTDSFVYQAEDGDGALSDPVTVKIIVTEANVDPEATDDVVAATEDTKVTGNVLTNDSDANYDPLTVVTPGTFKTPHGIVTLNADGTFEYTPDPDYSGYDTFTYQVTDGDPSGTPSTGVVSIYVEPVNDPPLAVADAVETNQDTPVIFNVIGNDTDPDGDTLTLFPTGTFATAHGQVIVSEDGTIVYTPDEGYVGSDRYTYLVVDSVGHGASATVSIEVKTSGASPVNEPPVANPDQYTTLEDTPVNGNVLTNDTDAEDGTPGLAELIAGASHGLVILDAAGNFTYVPADNFNGTDSFTYRAVDSSGAGSVTTVFFNIGIVNDKPVTAPDAANGPQDSTIPGNVLSNDYDPEQTPLTARYVLLSGPSHGSVTLNESTGDFSYTPVSGFSGSDGFRYAAVDRGGASSEDSVTLTVIPEKAAAPKPPQELGLPEGAKREYDDAWTRGHEFQFPPVLLDVTNLFSRLSVPYDEANHPIAYQVERVPPGPDTDLRLAEGYSPPQDITGPGQTAEEALSEALRSTSVLSMESLRISRGLVDSITELAGFVAEVAHGKRLDFETTEIGLWHSLLRESPLLQIGGSIGEDTPLEGFAPAVEAGKRLNFAHYPIEETVSIKLHDLKIVDLLGF